MGRHFDARPKLSVYPTLEQLYVDDKGRCWLCRREVEPEEASRDHVIPKSHGGRNIRWNIRLAHRRCNQRRGARPASKRAIAAIYARKRHDEAKQRAIRAAWLEEQRRLAETVPVPDWL